MSTKCWETILSDADYIYKRSVYLWEESLSDVVGVLKCQITCHNLALIYFKVSTLTKKKTWHFV